MFCDTRLGGLEHWYAEKPPDADMRIGDELLECTCFLCVKDGKQFKAGGTAFLLKFPSSSVPDIEWIYLVTAKHCINEARKYGKIYVRLNRRDGTATELELPDDGWTFADDPASDVAVMPFCPDAAVFQTSALLWGSGLDAEKIQKNHIGVGNETVIIGLFTKRHGTHQNIPIVRAGTVSAMPGEKIPDEKTGLSYDAFLVEARSIGGLSGSPVFVHVPTLLLEKSLQKYFPLSGFLFLAGIIRGYFDEPPFIETLGEKPRRLNTGIAIVTPIWEAIDTIMNNQRLKKQREADLQDYHKKHAATLDSGFGDEDSSEQPFTKADFEDALRKVSRKITPKKPR